MREPLDLSSIDVIVCTWNSNKAFFPTCLAMIKKNVPVHHLIAVDRNSSDGTRESIERFFPDATVMCSSESLGWARKRGVELVDTPYFAFIDDDVEIPVGWFKRLTAQLDSKIGAIHELDYMVDLPSEVEKWDGWISHSLGVKTETTAGEFVDVTSTLQNSVRGLTHNTLIMTALLTDWNPPPFTSSFEDWLIMKHVVAKGYAWRMVLDRTIKHHFVGGTPQWCRKATWNLVGGRVTGFNSPGLKWYLMKAMEQTPKALSASLTLRDPLILPYVIRLHASYIDSYLRWPKYVSPHR